MHINRMLETASPVAPLRQLVRSRWAPLATVLALAVAAQVILAATHPHIPSAPDSREYLASAAKIMHSGQFVDARRTPGYPSLLALVFLFAGWHNLSAVVVVQCILCLLAAVEVYALANRLTGHAWLACLAAAPVALNLYMLDWAYSIRDEAFSYWLIVTLFLVTERLARQIRPELVAVFTILALLLILTRPLENFVPALILVALAARGVLLGQWRQHALALGLSLLLIYAGVGVYAAINRVENGYFGISYVSDVNLFGKVMEYRLADTPVPPAMQTMQRRAVSYGFHGDGSPWDFARAYGYEGDHYAALGAYARYVIPQRLPQYAAKSFGDVVHVWLHEPGMDAQGDKSLPLTLLSAVARKALQTYLALPFVAAWLALLLRSGWRNPATFMTALLLLTVLASIGMVGFASFAEFYRLRTPIDWAYLLALMVVVIDLAGRIYQRATHRAHSV